jgi:hypothetical protein
MPSEVSESSLANERESAGANLRRRIAWSSFKTAFGRGAWPTLLFVSPSFRDSK